MKVKALVSFAGAVSMYAGETRDIDDNIARDLLHAGYVIEDKADKADKAQEAEIVVKPTSKAKSKKTR